MVRAVQGGLAVAGVAGVLLLVVATFAAIVEIKVGGSGDITAKVDTSLSGYDRHSLALLLIGGAALALHVGALRGARPAMLALAVCGLTVLLIAIVGDAPDLDDAGPVAELYEDARAQAGTGFYLETLGGALLLVAGVGMLVVGGSAAAVLGGLPVVDRRSDEEPAAAPQEPAGPSAAQRLAGGAAARVAAAREARTAQQARKAQRDEARRAREAQRAEREAAEAERAETAALPPVVAPDPVVGAPEPVEVPEPAAEPAAPSTDTAGEAPLTFEERLRQAKERAGRRST